MFNIKIALAALYSFIAPIVLFNGVGSMSYVFIVGLIVTMAFSIFYTISRGATHGIVPEETMYKF